METSEGDEDVMFAWRLQQEELQNLLGFHPREACLSGDDWQKPSPDRTSLTGDEATALEIQDRQQAYNIQLEEDEAMARELATKDDAATAREFSIGVDEATAREFALVDDMTTAQEFAAVDDETVAHQVATMDGGDGTVKPGDDETLARGNESDETLAQEMQSRQAAYMLQLEEDEAMARSLADGLHVNDRTTSQGLPSRRPYRGRGNNRGRRRGQGHRGQDHQGQTAPDQSDNGLVEQFMHGNMPDDYETLMDLAEQLGEGRDPGLVPGQINTLPTQTYHTPPLEGASGGVPDEDSMCKVCLDEFTDGDTLRCLPCLHKYHKTCIDEWLQKKARCPLCNLEVKEAIK